MHVLIPLPGALLLSSELEAQVQRWRKRKP
jgi:hypothetical protein